MMKLGDMGPNVLALTQQLVGLGLLAAAGPIFNSDVASAVKRYQASNLDPQGDPLVIDGEVGPLTAWALARTASGAAPIVPPRPVLVLPAGGGSRTGLAALGIALAEYRRGAGETGGNNRGPDVEAYQHHDPDLAGESWCASFVSWCFEQGNGGVSPFGYSAGARDIHQRFKKKGWLYKASPAQPPQPGDVIFWWREAIDSWKGHIGIVHSYENGFVHTIEGNRGDFPSKVSTYRYVLGRIDQLLGFGQAQP